MEENEKKEEKSGRKKIIKNVAIIFTVALLLLTFFSNTIMNHSLPEVSTTTVSSGSVQQKVRCQGDVETAKDVEITVSGERVVKEVFVESGDEVKKGDMIVSFNEAENPELKKAEADLKDKEREHEKKLLTMGVDYTDDYKEIEDCKQDVADAEEALKKAKADEANVSYTQEQAEAAKARLMSQQDVVTELQEQFDNYSALFDYSAVAEQITAKENELNNLDGEINQLNSEINTLNADIDKLGKEIEEKTALRDSQDPASAEYTSLSNEIEFKTGEKTSKEEAVSEKIERRDQIENPYYKTQLEEELSGLKSSVSEVTEIADRLAQEKAELARLEAEIENGSAKPDAEAVSVEQAEKDLKKAQDTLESKQRALNKKIEQDALDKQKDDIDMMKELEELEEMRKEVQKLKDQDDTACIVAPNDGIITNISLKEGDKINNENPIATIQLAESGYEVATKITKADGRLIHVGDEAVLENVWSSDATATVKSIKADPDDPNKSLIVKFEVKGSDINVGQTIQFAVGNKSQKYDTVVPNNAVKEDTSGNFVLVVKVKSTPLGNRYTVKKVEVTKLASDTTKCAISGDVMEYDNVVTNASKRIENGQQVRLSEKQ
ncbi:MAG: HlyD family efflux transporter periplasmic adaptor subunit [Eubacterium sp.]|nr:HlyD family efflux transporter periplasmic adaptor subunit [Eubacterium sp.]